jgi:hypothetical protein
MLKGRWSGHWRVQKPQHPRGVMRMGCASPLRQRTSRDLETSAQLTNAALHPAARVPSLPLALAASASAGSLTQPISSQSGGAF